MVCMPSWAIVAIVAISGGAPLVYEANGRLSLGEAFRKRSSEEREE